MSTIYTFYRVAECFVQDGAIRFFPGLPNPNSLCMICNEIVIVDFVDGSPQKFAIYKSRENTSNFLIEVAQFLDTNSKFFKQIARY